MKSKFPTRKQIYVSFMYNAVKAELDDEEVSFH